MLIGFFLVRPIPLPSSEAYHDPIDVDHAEADAASLAPSIISGYGHENNSRTHLLTHEDTGLEAGLGQAPTTNAEEDARTKTGIEMSPPRRSSRSPQRTSRHRSSSTRRSFSQSGRLLLDTGPNIFGAQLWKSIDFWIPFISLSLCGFFS